LVVLPQKRWPVQALRFDVIASAANLHTLSRRPRRRPAFVSLVSPERPLVEWPALFAEQRILLPVSKPRALFNGCDMSCHYE
jgi:hypothetical protein